MSFSKFLNCELDIMEAVSPKPARLSLVHGEKRPKPVCMESCGPKIEEKQPGRKVPGLNLEEKRARKSRGLKIV